MKLLLGTLRCRRGFLCFIINCFNDKTTIAMDAAILPNLLRFSMLRKSDVTSVVSKTLLRTFYCKSF